MTVEERAARGSRYVTLKAECEELFDGVRTHLLDLIEQEAPGSANILEMHRGLQNLAKLREAIKLVVMDGQHAEAAIRQAQMHRG